MVKSYDYYIDLPKEIKVTAKWHKFGYPHMKPKIWAEKMVNEGRAIWINKDEIEIILNRKQFFNHIINRENGKCFYCGKLGNTVDHIQLYSEGGLLTPKNCICACNECNSKRGDMPIEKFLTKEELEKLELYIKSNGGIIKWN